MTQTQVHSGCALSREDCLSYTTGHRPGFCVFTDALSHATRKRRVPYSASRQRLVLLYLTTLLVSNSYSPEPNAWPVHRPLIPRALQTPSPARLSPSPTETHSSWAGFAARAILPCFGTMIGGCRFATSVANGSTDSARVWTPSTMTCSMIVASSGFVPSAAVKTAARPHLTYTVWTGQKLPFLIPPQ